MCSVIGFDWDGTLVKSWTATPLPGVRERLAELPPGTKTFIATNQARPVWRQMTRDAKYPTCEDVAGRIIAGFAALEWRPDALFVSICANLEGEGWGEAANAVCRDLIRLLRGMDVNPRSVSTWPADRKPAPGMLRRAKDTFKYARMANMLYIGDMDTDHQAAVAAGGRCLGAAVWRERGLGL